MWSFLNTFATYTHVGEAKTNPGGTNSITDYTKSNSGATFSNANAANSYSNGISVTFYLLSYGQRSCLSSTTWREGTLCLFL